VTCPLCGGPAVQIGSGLQAVRYRCLRNGARFSLDRDTSAAELAQIAQLRDQADADLPPVRAAAGSD